MAWLMSMLLTSRVFQCLMVRLGVQWSKEQFLCKLLFTFRTLLSI